MTEDPGGIDRLQEKLATGVITRKQFMRGAAALSLSLPMASLIACTRSETGGATASDGGSGTNTLILGAAATPTTLDPEFSSSPQDRESDVAVYDRFTQFNIIEADGVRQADLKSPPIPLLADSWDVSSDKRTYTFHLHRGVKSYFGNELTSEDVVWSWDRVFGQQSQGLFPLNVSSVDAGSYRALGKYVVEVRLANANPLLPIVLATPVPGAVIYDSTEVKRHATADDKWAKKWLATNTASFGPYHATQFTPGQQAVYEANPNYFRQAPDIRKVIYKEIPDPANRLSLLTSGQIHIAEDLNAQQRQSLSSNDALRSVDVPGNLMIAFGVNNSMPPFDDPRVRQAVAHAMPIDGIIETVFFNDPTVRLFKGYVADTFPGYPEYWPYQPQSLDKARELLQQAGQSSIDFELSYTTTYPEHEKIATLIKSELEPAGITVSLSKLTPAKYQEQYYTHKAQSVLVQDAAFVADSAYPLYLYFGAGKGAVGNWINYKNASVQQQIDRALGEPDLAKRTAMSVGADKAIVGGVPWPMHLGIGFHLPMQSSVSGFAWRPHNLVHFYDLKKS